MDNAVEQLRELQKEPVVILASRLSRIIAFILDFVLISTFTIMFLTTFVIPLKYPGTISELRQLAHQPENSQKQLLEKMSPQLKEMIQGSQTIIIMILWLYFTLNEVLLRGASLGKKVFSIYVVNTTTLAPPSLFDSILRSGLKTFSLLAWFPIFTINFFLIFITKKAQAGHDFLTRTIVIQGDTKKEKDN